MTVAFRLLTTTLMVGRKLFMDHSATDADAAVYKRSSLQFAWESAAEIASDECIGAADISHDVSSG